MILPDHFDALEKTLRAGTCGPEKRCECAFCRERFAQLEFVAKLRKQQIEFTAFYDALVHCISRDTVPVAPRLAQYLGKILQADT